ncbi:MAG: hypothetical protein JO089_06625 [Alphaproteobacteria bacterium]|nr:hypothetical protein [Alphaproteobacteria bacterium]
MALEINYLYSGAFLCYKTSMSLDKHIDLPPLKPGETHEGQVKAALGKLTFDDPHAFLTELKWKVGEELRKPGVTEDSLAAVIGEVVRGKKPPANTAEEKELQKTAHELAAKILALKTDGNSVDKALETFSSSVDRTEHGGSFPTGVVVGGAAGLTGAMLLDIGDWKSFGGILKKLALISGGLVVGGLIDGDFEKLSLPFLPGTKDPSQTR